MDTLVGSFLGLLLGAIATYLVYRFYKKKQSKEVTQQQSTVLLEKIRSVSKLISVEGEFATLYELGVK